MLAADGLTVSISTLSRHLGAKRKGRERDRNVGDEFDREPSSLCAEQRSRPPEIAPTNAGKRTADGEARPIPPMPSPFPSDDWRDEAQGATGCIRPASVIFPNPARP